MYISGRLYSKDPEFWKETLALLHCRRGLMFVCWKKFQPQIVLVFQAISASMFLLSLFLLKKECNIHFRIIKWMGVNMGNSRVTTISDAHDLSVLLIYDHWKPCHNNHISWYLWETKPKISKVLYFTIKTIAINSVVRAEKPTALINMSSNGRKPSCICNH